MASPTSRLLELLELLQTRPLTTGREIADQLGIDARTARRYVGVLQELGIPVEGPARRRRRLPDPAGLPAAAADARRRGGGRRRARPARDPRLGVGRLRGRGRRRAGEDQPRPACDAAPAGRGARGDARLHDDDGGARRPTPPRCSCSPTRSAAAGGCTWPTARSTATSPSARSARTASSSTGAAGTSPRTTTCATTSAPSGSTGCGARRSRTPPRSRRRRASTPSST